MAKPFSWSYSKVKAFETCPRRHNEVDILKNFQDSSDALEWGNKVHGALADYLKSAVPLPVDMADYEKWAVSLASGSGELLVEQKYALTKDLQPTEWFGNKAWFRGVCDALRVNGDIAIAVDWKTGKRKDDAAQLMLMCFCILVHHPDVTTIEGRFVWLQEDEMARERWTRTSIMNEWVGMLDRVAPLEHAAETGNYPPKPGRLCGKWCPVTTCEYYGKSSR